MKIKGWEKIHGYTYKGYCIVNPIHNADETKYEATILDLNDPTKPKWELTVLTPAHKFKSDDSFSIFIKDDENRSTITNLHKERMQSIVYFRCTFEEMIDKLLGMRLTSAPMYSSHSISGGIINYVNNSGTTIPYGQMVQSIQSIQQTIQQLTK
jgi:hypothetical protein